MIRLITAVVLLGLLPPKTYAQITVFQDEKGQVFTKGGFSPKAYAQLPYLGSPFLTFPIWQQGKLRLDAHGQELTAQLAYDLVANELLCRFPGDSTIKIITPEIFTLNGNEFVRQQDKLLGIDYRLYTTVLYDGQTKLLASLTKRIERYASSNNGYSKEMEISGAYTLLTNYYIRKGNAKPEFIVLTKSSVLAALYEQADKLTQKLPRKQLTTAEVATTLASYDSLMARDWINKPSLATTMDSAQAESVGYAISKASLSKDPIFNQALKHHISYPSQAWTQGIYGRVYAGFEISQQGRIKHIVILSPDTMEIGFIESVRAGLERLPDLDPALSGNYVLPITFTYTNTREHTGAHVPTNRLATERLAGRTLLEEFMVPIVVSKPIIVSRETWGYYK